MRSILSACLFLFGLGLLAMECAYLGHQMGLVDIAEFDEIDPPKPEFGSATSRHGEAFVRAPQNAGWKLLNTGDGFLEGSVVRTLARSSAKIRIANAGEVEIEENSVARLVSLPMGIELQLDHGTARIRSQGAAFITRVAQKDFQVTSGSEVIVSKAALDDRNRVQVKVGMLKSADERQPASSVVFSGGESAEVVSGKMTKFQTSLNITPTFPKPDARLILTREIVAAKFAWDGDEASLLEVSERDDFLDPRRFRTNGKEAIAELGPGLYYWRVSKAGATSPAQRLALLPRIQYSLLAPLPNSTQPTNELLTFSWTAIPRIQKYTVQLSRKPDFTKLEWEKDTEKPTLTAEVLPAGNYFWRLKAKNEAFGEWPYSNPSAFAVKKTGKR